MIRKQLLLFSLIMLCVFAQKSRAQEVILSDFDTIVNIAIAPNGVLYVLDSQRATVSRFTLSGDLEFSIGSVGFGSNRFDNPTHLQLSSGLTLLLSDPNNGKVSLFDRNLQLIGEINERSSDKLKNWKPTFATSLPTGEFWVFDANQTELIRFDSNGQLRSISNFPKEIQPKEIGKMILSTNYIWLFESDFSIAYQFSLLGKYLKFLKLPELTKICTWDKEQFITLNPDSIKTYNEIFSTEISKKAINLAQLNQDEIIDLVVFKETIYVATKRKIMRLDLSE